MVVCSNMLCTVSINHQNQQKGAGCDFAFASLSRYILLTHGHTRTHTHLLFLSSYLAIMTVVVLLLHPSSSQSLRFIVRRLPLSTPPTTNLIPWEDWLSLWTCDWHQSPLNMSQRTKLPGNTGSCRKLLQLLAERVWAHSGCRAPPTKELTDAVSEPGQAVRCCAL